MKAGHDFYSRKQGRAVLEKARPGGRYSRKQGRAGGTQERIKGEGRQGRREVGNGLAWRGDRERMKAERDFFLRRG